MELERERIEDSREFRHNLKSIVQYTVGSQFGDEEIFAVTSGLNKNNSRLASAFGVK
jgi:hypothetical protein